MSRVDERVPSLRGHFVPKLTPCYSRQVAIKYRAFRQAVDFQWFFPDPSLRKLRPSSTHQARKGRSSGQLWHLPAPMERNLVAPSPKNVRRPPSQHPLPSSTGRVSSPISGAGGHQVPIKHRNPYKSLNLNNIFQISDCKIAFHQASIKYECGIFPVRARPKSCLNQAQRGQWPTVTPNVAYTCAAWAALPDRPGESPRPQQHP